MESAGEYSHSHMEDGGDSNKSKESWNNPTSLLLLSTCLVICRYAAAPGVLVAESTLQLSRVSSVVMLVAYIGYIIFQLKTHRQIFEGEEEEAVIGFWSGFSWLVGMTLIIALLSEYVVGTIEDSAAQISMFAVRAALIIR
ncbi:hypothetical protein V6N13_002040 [Hibiscus sabdariffa]